MKVYQITIMVYIFDHGIVDIAGIGIESKLPDV